MTDPEAAAGVRFIVRSVTGYTNTSSRSRPMETFYVLDRAFCSREVAHADSKDDRHLGFRERYPAQQHADRLNERYGPWPT